MGNNRKLDRPHGVSKDKQFPSPHIPSPLNKALSLVASNNLNIKHLYQWCHGIMSPPPLTGIVCIIIYGILKLDIIANEDLRQCFFEFK